MSLDAKGKPVFHNYTPEEIEKLLKDEKVEVAAPENP